MCVTTGEEKTIAFKPQKDSKDIRKDLQWLNLNFMKLRECFVWRKKEKSNLQRTL